MHDGANVRAVAVDHQVHTDFAGGVAAPCQTAAAQIHGHHVRGAHHALADQRWGSEDAAIVEEHGKIALGGRDQAAIVEHLAEANQVPAMVAPLQLWILSHFRASFPCKKMLAYGIVPGAAKQCAIGHDLVNLEF